jgi:hypothetical protein
MRCKICSSLVTPFGRAIVLQKYQVEYFRCNHCGFIQTEKPFWLSESYSESIALSDIGLIGRNIKFSNITAVIISAFFDSRSQFLDYGGGNGMFVRLMRDKGFNFFWQDQYTVNQFARDFEFNSKAVYHLLTAFEVFEHLEDPISEVQKMLLYSDNILFSTNLIPPTHPLPGEWWYYAVDSGQHISFYTEQSLKELANKFNLHLYTNGKSLHLLTKKRIPKLLFFLFSIGQIAGPIGYFFSIGRKSLLERDYFYITGNKLK